MRAAQIDNPSKSQFSNFTFENRPKFEVVLLPISPKYHREDRVETVEEPHCHFITCSIRAITTDIVPCIPLQLMIEVL